MSRADPGGRISAGAWFGAQVGATAFLAGVGVATWFTDPLTGLIFVAGFVAANLWGCLAWRSRHRWLPRIAIQMMLAGVALAVSAAVLLANYRAMVLHIPLWVLLVFPGIMVMLWFLTSGVVEAAEPGAAAGESERRGRGSPTPGEAKGDEPGRAARR